MKQNPLRILVIEDNENDFRLLGALLGQVGYQAYELEWVQEFAEAQRRLCDGASYDACLLDYRLGPHDGVELLDIAAECQCHYPMIVLTGRQDYELDLTVMRAGAADFLSKNELRPDMLERTIRYAIQQRRAEEERLKLQAEREARERAETLARTLAESEARYRTIGEAIPYGVWQFSTEGTPIYVSPSLLELFDVSLEEMRDPQWVEQLFAPKQIQDFTFHWQHCNRTGMDWEFEYEFTDGHGNWHAILSRGKPLRDHAGNISSWVGINLDITRRKEIERELFESEERFRTLAEALPQIVWSADLAGNMDYVNYRWIDYTGEVLNSKFNWKRVLHPDDLELTIAAWQQVLQNHESFQVEHRLRRYDGIYRWFLSRAVPFFDEQGNPVKWLGTATDIHDQKMAEAALKQLNETLEQRVAERTAVAEQRAAQLRVLAGELTQTEQRERRRLAQTLHDHLQQLLVAVKLKLGRAKGRQSPENVTAAMDLIDQCIQASRSLTVELSPPVVYDAGLAAGLDWLARWMREKHGLQVEVRADPAAQPEGEDLCICLFNSVRELLFNVVKHAGESRATVRMNRLNNDQVEIEISDQGCGFQPAIAAPQFTGGPGAGFGLFSIRERIELFNGTFELDSAPGRGTRVVLRAPLREVDLLSSGQPA
jgi:PAS domain S-box-containing protein